MGYVILILIGAVAISGYRWLGVLAEGGNESARSFLYIESLLLLTLAVIAVLGASQLRELACNDSCYGYEWWHKVDAWQWDAQFGAALAGAIAVAGSFLLTVKRSYGPASLCLVIAAPCFFPWAAFLAPLGDRLGI